MRNRNTTVQTRFIAPAGAILLTATSMIGCGKEEAPPPPPEPKPVVRVDPMAGIELDARVQWPDDREAWSPELAEAIAALANGIARSDTDLMQSALSSSGKRILSIAFTNESSSLAESEIEAVRVCVLHRLEDGRAELGLGIQDQGGAYLTGWIGREQSPGSWVFEGAPCEPLPAERVSMLDAERLTEPSLGTVATVRVEIDDELRKLLSGESRGGGGGTSGPDPQSAPFIMPGRRPR